MQKNEEKPVNAQQACATLGIGSTLMSALKCAMGIKSRYFFVSDVRQFMRKNPSFTVSNIYPRNRASHSPTRKMKLKHPSNTDHLPESVDAVALRSKEAPTNPASSLADQASAQKPIPSKIRRSGDWKTAMVIQKIKALRGEVPRSVIAARAGLSVETVRRFERGDHIGPSAFRSSASAMGMCEADWHELLSWRFVQEFGDDAQALLTSEFAGDGNRTESRHSREVIQLFETLDPQQQQIILRAMVEKEVFGCLLAMLDTLERRQEKSKTSDSSNSRPLQITKPSRHVERGCRSQILAQARRKNDIWSQL